MSQNEKSTHNLPWKEFFGTLGIVLVAYIGYLGNRSQTEIPIQASQTAEAKLTLTAKTNVTPDAIELPTVTSIATSAPTTIPTAIISTVTNAGTYNYFDNGCIESKSWTPYIQNEILLPSDKECLELLDMGISAQNQKLLFSVNNTDGYATKGIYTSVARNTDISFTVLIVTPKTYSAKFSYMGFGIGDANIAPVSGGFLYYRVDESPSTTIETGDWWGTFTNTVMQDYSFNEEYQITFSISDLDFSVFVDGKLAGRYNLSSKKNFFWISYRVPPDGELLASISDFMIKSR